MVTVTSEVRVWVGGAQQGRVIGGRVGAEEGLLLQLQKGGQVGPALRQEDRCGRVVHQLLPCMVAAFITSFRSFIREQIVQTVEVEVCGGAGRAEKIHQRRRVEGEGLCVQDALQVFQTVVDAVHMIRQLRPVDTGDGLTSVLRSGGSGAVLWGGCGLR